MVSHPLSMREALGSIPSVSMSCARAARRKAQQAGQTSNGDMQDNTGYSSVGRACDCRRLQQLDGPGSIPGGRIFGIQGRVAKTNLQRNKAHPDLNQGPADMQSAAPTTEQCTQLLTTTPRHNRTPSHATAQSPPATETNTHTHKPQPTKGAQRQFGRVVKASVC